MKNEIRKHNKLMRSQLSEQEVAQKSRLVSNTFLESNIYKNCRCLMLYMPLGNETDTSHIIKEAFNDGKKVVFPVTDAKTGVITPYYADGDTKFKVGAFSVTEPVTGKIARPEDIDVILVPGIAFDRKGNRVGFGKGCYDRLLKSTKAIKVGYCYLFQICDEIPAESHDIKMDYIVNEKGIIEC